MGCGASSASAITPAAEQGTVKQGNAAKYGYAEFESRRAKDPELALPKTLHLQSILAAEKRMAGCIFERDRMKQQLEELESALAEMADGDPYLVQKTERLLNGRREQYARCEEDVRLSTESLRAIEAETSKLIAPWLARDEALYTQALRRLDEAEPGMLQRVNIKAAAMGNKGALPVGKVVQVVHQGHMVRARVEREVDSDLTVSYTHLTLPTICSV